MVGWHHRLNGHEFEQTLRDGEGQGSLVAAVHGGGKELDTTWRLNNRIAGRGEGCFCWFYGVSSVNQASIKGWLCPICSI